MFSPQDILCSSETPFIGAQVPVTIGLEDCLRRNVVSNLY